jgi:serine/threonine-protein kinase HipA
MAKAAGIAMSECRLMEENGRHHFMTRRFDRHAGGGKLHMQSLGGLAHFDFNQPGAHSYEQALLMIRQLKLPMAAVEEQFRRMVFNVVARNQDDHVKNIAFLMNKQGEWSLAPAFDMTYSYNPSGSWTGTHQMTLNGKRDGFGRGDFEAGAKSALMKRGRAAAIMGEVLEAVKQWPEFAARAKLSDALRERIQKQHRLDFPKG